MRRFDYSFLRTGVLPARFLNLAVNIAGLKTMAGVRKESYEKIFTELEAVAKVQSVKSSNAIEGIVTSDDRIAAIVNGNSAPLNHNEAEIAGYRDALAVIHENFFDESGGSLKGMNCHELSFYFLMKPRGTMELHSNSMTMGVKEETRWIPIADLDKYKAYPTFLKEFLSKKHKGIEHIVTDERIDEGS